MYLCLLFVHAALTLYILPLLAMLVCKLTYPLNSDIIQCIVGTTKVWVWPMKNITQKPVSLFPDDNEAVLVRVKLSPNKLSD